AAQPPSNTVPSIAMMIRLIVNPVVFRTDEASIAHGCAPTESIHYDFKTSVRAGVGKRSLRESIRLANPVRPGAQGTPIRVRADRIYRHPQSLRRPLQDGSRAGGRR